MVKVRVRIRLEMGDTSLSLITATLHSYDLLQRTLKSVNTTHAINSCL